MNCIIRVKSFVITWAPTWVNCWCKCVGIVSETRQRTIAYETTNFLTTPYLVSQSDYVVTISERLVKTFFSHLDLDIYPLPIQVSDVFLTLCWHPLKDNEPAHRWIRNIISEFLGSQSFDDSVAE